MSSYSSRQIFPTYQQYYFFLRTVALVLLKSTSSNPVAPESVKLMESIPSPEKDNVAFIAKDFHVTEFQGDSIEVSLRVYKENERRKREAVEVPALTPGATYRFSQLNRDESKVRRDQRILLFFAKTFQIEFPRRALISENFLIKFFVLRLKIEFMF